MRNLIICLLIACQAQAQTPTTVLGPATPAEGGFSAERLSRIDAKMKEWIDGKMVNGGVAFIAREGKVVYHKAFGWFNKEKKLEMRADDIFRIASQTKAITSVAVMILVEEGKIALSDPVSKFIPEFAKPTVVDKFNMADTTWTTVPANREITIKDLITHTSGLGYAQIGTPEAQAMYRKHGITAGLGIAGHSLAADMKKLGKLPLLFQPGEQWMYSLGDDVLGHVIEVVSGMPLDRFMRKRIFEPLGMYDTWFYLPKDRQGRLTALYAFDSTGVHPMGTDVIPGEKAEPNFPNSSDNGYFSGGGGLSGTIKDYAIFLQMMLNGGIYNGKRILSRNTVRMMTTDQFQADKSGKMIPFGLGFGITTKAGAASTPQNEGSFAWGGAFGTLYWVDPKEKIVALLYFSQLPVMVNSGEVFPTLVYQGLE